MIRTTRSGAEILQRFEIQNDFWVVMCIHDTCYGIWNMDDDGFCSRGELLPSLESANLKYYERIKLAMHNAWEQRICE